MRILFVKHSLAWPRSAGHDVHAYHMMRAMGEAGHDISLACVERPRPEATGGLKLAETCVLGQANGCDVGDSGDQDSFPNRTEKNPVSLLRAGEGNSKAVSPLSYLQRRFCSYWGIEACHIEGVRRAIERTRAAAVVVVGLEVLPYLAGAAGCGRVWYAADEWVWHHLSQVRWSDGQSWENIRSGAIKGLYEWAFRSLLDRVWVVSEADRRAMRWVTGLKEIDVIPNGVDADYYSPQETTEIERSCVFWGRLDFGPNIQALQWFCDKVWPALSRQAPQARFTIYGFQPTDPVRALATREGISLVADLPDIRAEAARHQVVVLPFQSGGGIKNKLLEAASMARPIVCSTCAGNGMRLPQESPLRMAGKPGQWVGEILRLWGDAGLRKELGARARRWVVECHSWTGAARAAVSTLERLLAVPRAS